MAVTPGEKPPRSPAVAAGGSPGDRHARLNLSNSVGGLGRSVAWTYISLLGTASSALFVMSYAFRVLGASDFGVYALMIAIANLALVVEFGLSLVVVRATALRDDAGPGAAHGPDEDDVHAAHAAYGIVGLAVSVFASVVCLLWFALEGDATRPLSALLISLGVAVNLAFAALPGIVTGRRRFNVIAWSALAQGAVIATLASVLLPLAGLVGLGVAHLAAAVVSRTCLGIWVRSHVAWFRFLWRRPRRAALVRVIRLGTPLVLSNAGTAAINTANLTLIAALTAPTVVGIFRVASAVPAQLVTIVYRGFDVVFPNLVGVRDNGQQEELNAVLTRITSYLAGCGFGLLIICREPLIELITGSESRTAEVVLVLASCSWLVNIPVHGLVLLVIARGEQGRLVPLAVAEGLLTLSLTAVLTPAFGAPGAASAVLLSLFVVNVILFPVVLRRILQTMSAYRILFREGYLRILAGVATCAVASLAVQDSHSPLAVLVGTAAVTGLGALPVGYVAVGRRGRQTLRAAARREPPRPA